MVTFLNQSVTTWLKQTFTEADKNGDGSLSISEVLQLLHKLNVNLPRQKVKQMFKVQSKLTCVTSRLRRTVRDTKACVGTWFSEVFKDQ